MTQFVITTCPCAVTAVLLPRVFHSILARRVFPSMSVPMWDRHVCGTLQTTHAQYYLVPIRQLDAHPVDLLLLNVLEKRVTAISPHHRPVQILVSLGLVHHLVHAQHAFPPMNAPMWDLSATGILVSLLAHPWIVQIPLPGVHRVALLLTNVMKRTPYAIIPHHPA